MSNKWMRIQSNYCTRIPGSKKLWKAWYIYQNNKDNSYSLFFKLSEEVQKNAKIHDFFSYTMWVEKHFQSILVHTYDKI